MNDPMPGMSLEHEALIQFLYLAPVGLVQADIDGAISMINPISAQLLMPLARGGDLSNLFAALESVAPDLRPMCAGYAPPSGTICDALQIPVNAAPHGKAQPMILSLTIVKLDHLRIMAVLSDVTQQVQRERQLRQSDAWLNAILTNITDYALIGLDAAGCVRGWNDSIGRVTGFSAADVIGKPFSMFSAPDATTEAGLLDRLHEADRNGWCMEEGTRQRADGSRFWGSALLAPLPDRDAAAPLVDAEGLKDAAYCLIIRDITDKREATQARQRAVFCDFLTGIGNRRAFFEQAELELKRSERVPRPTALVMFDLDHFKSVNDSHGHAGGDQVLCHFAAVLTAAFREVDIVARTGGEEFGVLMPSTDQAGALAGAERVLALVAAQPAMVDGVAVAYTVSAGIAILDGADDSLDPLMKRADQALYRAKNGGRNRTSCWSADPDAQHPR
ncbi:sensor domain-containing diguanylate cyclase [Massilia soli]|nr:sensor domain-containing diguanylate cyclase [Massilia soli]